MSQHQSTRALAAFAARFDPAKLPAEVRQKLGWLLLDHLRVCSIGARLPWSDWSRRYVDLVGKPGASHVMFSAATLNPQHATLLNVTCGSSFDGDDTMSARCCTRAWRRRGRRWRSASTPARRAGGAGRGASAGYETIMDRAVGAAEPFQAWLPKHRHLRQLRHRRSRRAGAVSPRFCATDRGHLGLAGGHASGLAQFYYSGGSAFDASMRRMRRRAASRRPCWRSRACLGPTTSSKNGGFARAYADGFNPALIEGRLGSDFI